MNADLELPGGRAGPSLSVVELWRASTILFLLLVVLHAFQSLAGKVLKHDVVIAGGKDKENGACLPGREAGNPRGSEGTQRPVPGAVCGQKALPGWHV